MARTKHVTRSNRSRNRAQGGMDDVRDVRDMLDLPVKTRRGRKRLAEVRTFRFVKAAGWLLFLALLAAGSLMTFRKAFHENPEFTLEHIEISELSRMSEQEVLAAADIPVMSNLIDLNLERIRSRIQALSQVAAVKVRRRLPDTLEITVTERKPVLWLAGGPVPESVPAGLNPARRVGGVLVDAEGYAIRCSALHREYMKLPVIHLEESFVDAIRFGNAVSSNALQSAVSLEARWRQYEEDLGHVLEAIDARRPFRLEAHCGSGLRVLFATEAVEAQFLKLIDVLHHGERRGRQFDSINLAVKTNVPVVYRYAAESEEPVDRAGTPVLETLDAPGVPTHPLRGPSAADIKAITTIDS